jgi:hypothetical protein
MNETLAFPATINMDKETEPAVISDDDTSISGQASNENVREQVTVDQEPPSGNQIEKQDDEGHGITS